MKAIIIAAGKGSRLKELTQDLPKCLLEVQGKPILQHQLDAYRDNGIAEISVVKGYCQEKIDYPDLKYYINDNYENNNILNSLMYAEQDMDGAFIASYSDIVFKSSIVEQLLKEPYDITIIADAKWQDYYEGRTNHPLSEAERVWVDDQCKVTKIGKDITEDHSGYEFIGMLKCSQEGAKIFKEYFHKAKTVYDGQPFIRAKTFEKAYITDFLQYLTDQGVSVHCSVIEHGWCEIDIEHDLKNAQL